MAGWQIGLVVMMAVGVAVILFGALWDRERNRRRAEQLTRPPDRPIPGYAGDSPAYVTDPRPAGGTRELSPADRSALRVRLESVPAFAAPLAAGDFVSDPPSGWAVLEQPQVLVCAEPVQTLRELLPFLDRAAGTETPIVLAAPGYDPVTQETLVVNHSHRRLRVIAVTADGDTLAAIAKATNATPVTRVDLQSGWLPAEAVGTVDLWVSSTAQSWLIGP